MQNLSSTSPSISTTSDEIAFKHCHKKESPQIADLVNCINGGYGTLLPGNDLKIISKKIGAVIKQCIDEDKLKLQTVSLLEYKKWEKLWDRLELSCGKYNAFVKRSGFNRQLVQKYQKNEVSPTIPLNSDQPSNQKQPQSEQKGADPQMPLPERRSYIKEPTTILPYAMKRPSTKQTSKSYLPVASPHPIPLLPSSIIVGFQPLKDGPSSPQEKENILNSQGLKRKYQEKQRDLAAAQQPAALEALKAASSMNVSNLLSPEEGSTYYFTFFPPATHAEEEEEV